MWGGRKATWNRVAEEPRPEEGDGARWSGAGGGLRAGPASTQAPQQQAWRTRGRDRRPSAPGSAAPRGRARAVWSRSWAFPLSGTSGRDLLQGRDWFLGAKKKKSVFLDKAQVFMQNIKSVFVVLKFHNGDWEGVGGGQRWYE